MADPYKLLITIRRAPHGSIYVMEAIEVMFIMAAYDMDLSVAFLDDGVFALKQGQDTKALEIKGFSANLGALVDFEVSQVYADERSLKDRNITEEQLISIGEDEDTEEPLYPKMVSTDELKNMMHTCDAVISF